MSEHENVSTGSQESGRLAPEPVPRRDVLGLAGLWTAGLAVFGSIIGMARLPRPRVLPEPSGKVKVGKPGDFPPGTVLTLADRNLRIESRDAGLVALSLVCTHLGCVVTDEEGVFLCPCHGSKFGPDGNVLQGPAPRALRWLELSQAPDGSILADIHTEVPEGTYFEV